MSRFNADIARSHTQLIRHIGTVPVQLWHVNTALVVIVGGRLNTTHVMLI